MAVALGEAVSAGLTLRWTGGAVPPPRGSVPAPSPILHLHHPNPHQSRLEALAPTPTLWPRCPPQTRLRGRAPPAPQPCHQSYNCLFPNKSAERAGAEPDPGAPGVSPGP